MSFGSYTIKKNIIVSNTNFNDGSLSGYVNDSFGNPIEGALVRIYFHETYEEGYSDSTGYYYVDNIPICYCYKNATCSKEGYKTEWVLLSIYENTTQDFVLISDGNNPPSVPTITGPSCGKVGVAYAFTFCAVDLDGDLIKYLIDWGDGNTYKTDLTPSGINVTVSHFWTKKGCYLIRARAQDEHGLDGLIGTPLIPITITTKSKNVNVEDCGCKIKSDGKICDILWNHLLKIADKGKYIEELMEKYKNNSFIYKLLNSYWYILNLIALQYLYLGVIFKCYWTYPN